MSNASSSRTRIALVGLGYWGPNLLRVLGDMEDVDVAYLCDLDALRLRRFARRHPQAAVTDDLEQVLQDPSVDGVVVATPIHTHFALASRCLEAGKHTFVEKPLAASTAQADELLAHAERRDVLLMCGQTFLYSPPVRAVKQLLEGDEIGKVYFISSSRVNLGPYRRDASVVWDLGPHDFAILLYWLGQMPTRVRALGRDAIAKGRADVAFVWLDFPSRVVANVELSWLAPSKLRRTTIVGSKKMIVYEDGSPEPIKVYDHGIVYNDPETFGEYHLSYRTGDILLPRVEAREPLAEELADFVASIRSGVVLHEFSALARNVVQLTESAEASLRSGGTEREVAPEEPTLLTQAAEG